VRQVPVLQLFLICRSRTLISLLISVCAYSFLASASATTRPVRGTPGQRAAAKAVSSNEESEELDGDDEAEEEDENDDEDGEEDEEDGISGDDDDEDDGEYSPEKGYVGV
jgi:hypothetical protein